jgi:trehalose 6-phosphate synthase/phosphatase
MSEGEKESRQAALYKIVTTHTSHTWAALLVHMLLTQIGNVNTAHQTPVLDRPLLKQRYSQAKRRLLLFDYDVCNSPRHSINIP